MGPDNGLRCQELTGPDRYGGRAEQQVVFLVQIPLILLDDHEIVPALHQDLLRNPLLGEQRIHDGRLPRCNRSGDQCWRVHPAETLASDILIVGNLS